MELLRILGVVGVIWFHIGGLPQRRIGFSGLIAFVLISVILMRSSAADAGLRTFTLKRTQRLIVPWLAWFATYLILNVATGRRPLPHGNDLISAVLTGPWIGLWYMPFAFAASLIAWTAYRASHRWQPLAACLAYCILGLCAFFVASDLRERTISAPWAQWLHAAPAIPLAIAVSMLLNGNAKWQWFIIPCSIPILYTIISQYSDPGLALTYLVAVPFTVIAFLIKLRLPRIIFSISALVMGVYLTHGALIALLKQLLGANASPYLIFSATVTAAFVASLVLKRLPYFKALV